VNDESTPRGAFESPAKATTSTLAHHSSASPGPRIDGFVSVNASFREPWTVTENHRVDRLLQEIAYAPSGTHVTITVKARQHVPVMSVEYLRDNGRHLGSITIACSDPDTIARWVNAFRGQGGWDV